MTDDSVDADADPVAAALSRVRRHDFHPVDERNFTIDRGLGVDGIADLEDPDWRVRLFAVAGLVRAATAERGTSEAGTDGAGTNALAAIRDGLASNDPHVRYVCAMALGIAGGEPVNSSPAGVSPSTVDALVERLQTDPNDLVRSQAAIALGQLGATDTLEVLEHARENDSRDVAHQAAVAIHRIETGATVTPDLAAAYRDLDPATLDPDSFDRVRTGETAPGFTLPTTDGERWDVTAHRERGKWLVLIWIFADWCPVCHREFDELIELRNAFADEDVAVATVECHDAYRGRLMVGEELEPAYWFAEESFVETYREEIWWPHLLDRAGAVGARWGVDPLAFAVHAEYINRPGTFVIDPEGVLRFAYVGTYWGDRPSIEETLELIRTGSFEYEHPERRG